MKRMTLEELTTNIKKIGPIFGELEIKAMTSDDTIQIDFFDNDKSDTAIDAWGNMVKGDFGTKIIIVSLNVTKESMRVGLVKHPYQYFSKSNIEEVQKCLDLVGVVISNPEAIVKYFIDEECSL